MVTVVLTINQCTKDSAKNTSAGTPRSSGGTARTRTIYFPAGGNSDAESGGIFPRPSTGLCAHDQPHACGGSDHGRLCAGPCGGQSSQPGTQPRPASRDRRPHGAGCAATGTSASSPRTGSGNAAAEYAAGQAARDAPECSPKAASATGCFTSAFLPGASVPHANGRAGPEHGAGASAGWTIRSNAVTG